MAAAEPQHLSDPERLAALDRSGLLAKPMDERLQRLVATAASVLRADAAQVNVLDATSQHRIARWPPVVCTQVMPVSEGASRCVVQTGRTLAVPDVREHPRLRSMPWAGTWNGYMGTPLSYEGHTIGALSVLTHAPRQWCRADNLALEAVGRLVSYALF